jgi:fructuronate reductase
MESLSTAALPALPEHTRPLMTPGDAGAGVLHLGVGAFHRAHQAVYTEAAMKAGGGDWAIIAVAPRTPEVVDALRAQDNLFSVVELDGAGARVRVCGAIGGTLHSPTQREAVLARLADPAIRVVTLTVTEKAYQPESAVMRLLAEGLQRRAIQGGAPLALVSCDNLPSNGVRLRQALENAPEGVSFPCTTVDRIVPATTEAVFAAARRELGVADGAAVQAEPYKQWVIEDDFPGGRPQWDLAGAVLTGDVAPWEQLKLRTLNGVHSTLAYLGALAGCETIADALSLPGMRDTLRRFIADEVAPSFVPPPGVDVVEYGDEVLERFANPAIRHRTIQVAMDGTQKLPYRVLETVRNRRREGAEPRYGALVIAAWMRFAAGRDDDGRALPLDDPLATAVKARLAGGGSPVDALLGLAEVFPAEMAGDGVIRKLIATWYADLARHGATAVIARAAA